MDTESRLRQHLENLCRWERTPGSKGYFECQEYLRSALREIGLEPRDHSFRPLLVGPSTNIFAELGAGEPRILVGAHYESRDCSGPGADDNASAVAVTLELARKLKESGSGLPFTFCFFDLEENYRLGSLRGSAAFCRDYERALSEVVILDLVGGAFAPGMEKVYFQFGPALAALENANLEFLHMPIRVLEPLGYLGSMGPRSDYHAYRRRGIPFTFISSGTPWYYHTAEDRLERLHFSKMAALTETLFQILRLPKQNRTVSSFSGAIPASKSGGDWKNFFRLAEILSQSPALRSPQIDRMLAEQKPPSGLQLIGFYKHILTTLRKSGPKLWAA